MAAAPIVLAGIGLGSTIAGQVSAGVSQRNQTQREAEAAAEAAGQEAIVSEYEISKIRENAQKTQGAQIAGYGRSGVVLEGSPLRQLVETTQKAEEDVFWREKNRDYRIKMLKLQGTSALQAGQAGMIQTGLNTTGTFLSGLARLPGVF